MALPTTPPPTMATSQIWLMQGCSGCETRFDQAPHAGPAGEEAARKRGFPKLLAGELEGGRGDVEGLQVRPAEGDGGRPLHRHLDHPIDGALRGVTGHPPAVPMGAP